MALTSIIVICVFIVITWLDLMRGHVRTKVGSPEVEICTPPRHHATEVDNPPSYASIEGEEVPPPAYRSS